MKPSASILTAARRLNHQATFYKGRSKVVQDKLALVELYAQHGLLVSRMKILEHTKNARHFSVHPNARHRAFTINYLLARTDASKKNGGFHISRRLSKKDIYQKGQMIEVDVSPEERQERLETILNYKLTQVGPNQGTLATAWDNHKFAIHAMNSKYGQIMEDIYNAFLESDIVICDRGPLVNRLGIMIYSRIPEELKKEFADAEKRNGF